MAKLLLFLLVNFLTLGSGGSLSYDFYNTSCPDVEDVVRETLAPIFLTHPTAPAALLRLMFHDCQVQGCDASILLDTDHPRISSEMISSKNFGIKHRESIVIVKEAVESVCPNQVSCADIIVLAARESVAVSGGPYVEVALGRRDSTITDATLADTFLPSANVGVDEALRILTAKGLNLEESVAILGAHTLGATHCVNIMNRLYGPKADTGIVLDFKMLLQLNCPLGVTLASNATFVANDPTSLAFDNQFYQQILTGRGLLSVDSEMQHSAFTSPLVARFADHQDYFFRVFSSAFLKLSSYQVLTGNHGQIRKWCDRVN
ncbi:hypothetical protein AMTRI_Chr10g3420 [Amborella trichopoda]